MNQQHPVKKAAAGALLLFSLLTTWPALASDWTWHYFRWMLTCSYLLGVVAAAEARYGKAMSEVFYCQITHHCNADVLIETEREAAAAENALLTAQQAYDAAGCRT